MVFFLPDLDGCKIEIFRENGPGAVPVNTALRVGNNTGARNTRSSHQPPPPHTFRMRNLFCYTINLYAFLIKFKVCTLIPKIMVVGGADGTSLTSPINFRKSNFFFRAILKKKKNSRNGVHYFVFIAFQSYRRIYILYV